MIILFHGSFGSPEGNWNPYIKKNLEQVGQKVIVPAFPVDDWDMVTKNGPQKDLVNQNLQNWLNVFEEVIKNIPKGEKLYAVAHSLGCVFILHLVNRFGLNFEKVIFVSPFFETLNRIWQIDVANKTFYKTDFDFQKIIKHVPISWVIYGDNDPYVDIKYMAKFAEKMKSKTVVIKGGGHLNKDAGYLKFPYLLDLCRSEFI